MGIKFTNFPQRYSTRSFKTPFSHFNFCSEYICDQSESIVEATHYHLNISPFPPYQPATINVTLTYFIAARLILILQHSSCLQRIFIKVPNQSGYIIVERHERLMLLQLLQTIRNILECRLSFDQYN